jgi:hypothetical protein
LYLRKEVKNMTGINEFMLNKMRDVYVSEGCSLEEAKDKAINLIIDLNTSDKDVRDRLEGIVKEHGCLPYFDDIRVNHNNNLK